ncbi:MAG: hypothetical protein J6C13_04920 [Clostridia bacterium]|nr:hypothetical protein [Clostridia bacterium]
MALIKISHDIFDICDRVKEIDSGYYVVYNTIKNQYEIHNSKQKSNTFCIVCENGLNSRVITKLRKTRVENIEKVLKELEKHNEKLELDAKKAITDETSWKAREMFDYANKREEDCDFLNAYKTTWS